MMGLPLEDALPVQRDGLRRSHCQRRRVDDRCDLEQTASRRRLRTPRLRQPDDQIRRPSIRRGSGGVPPVHCDARPSSRRTGRKRATGPEVATLGRRRMEHRAWRRRGPVPGMRRLASARTTSTSCQQLTRAHTKCCTSARLAAAELPQAARSSSQSSCRRRRPSPCRRRTCSRLGCWCRCRRSRSAVGTGGAVRRSAPRGS